MVETPTSPSSSLALSRFEFETGKGNEGTKILMVEWAAWAGGAQQPASQQEEATTGSSGKDETRAKPISDWEVSWEGKTTVLPIRDSDPDVLGNTHRVYFLLPPGAPIPPLVTIVPSGHPDIGGEAGPTVLQAKPLPAIFPAELGGGQQEAGRRGVLHTIWAKKRLAELQAEIAAEMKENVESVGLEMAVQERQWIVDHFGLAQEHDDIPKPTRLHIPQSPSSPTTPRSPTGGRLSEKLRGLRLATSPAELAAATHVAKSAQPRTTQPLITTLSPVASDVAVSAFSSFAGGNSGGIASLDAMVGASSSQTTNVASTGQDAATEDELFALPMSPRSPEMKKSPFSLI